MRSRSTPGGDRSPSRSNFRGGAAGSGGDALRVVRATRDQLGVAWSAEVDPLFWQVVCWDSRDASVARLKLSGGTGARPSPVLLVCSSRSQSRFPAWGTMALWSGRPGLPIFIANAQPPKCGQPRKEGASVSEAAEEGCGASQVWQDKQNEAKEEDLAREVTAAGADRRRCVKSVR